MKPPHAEPITKPAVSRPGQGRRSILLVNRETTVRDHELE